MLDHGDEPFNSSFSTICGVRLSLMLKVGTYGNEDGALLDMEDCSTQFTK
ncbi:hypothetical protein EDB19DRAFT_1903059 [Suillus lakei]|nr:hypothetical protein EDB19DRAFT_1903059 [Suillus lakei]